MGLVLSQALPCVTLFTSLGPWSGTVPHSNFHGRSVA